jgi:hypothetical protein
MKKYLPMLVGSMGTVLLLLLFITVLTKHLWDWITGTNSAKKNRQAVKPAVF